MIGIFYVVIRRFFLTIEIFQQQSLVISPFNIDQMIFQQFFVCVLHAFVSTFFLFRKACALRAQHMCGPL